MKKIISTLLVISVLVLSGCTNLPKALNALAKDTNQLHILVIAPGYSILIDRNNKDKPATPIILHTTGTVPSLAPNGTNFIVLPQ